MQKRGEFLGLKSESAAQFENLWHRQPSRRLRTSHGLETDGPVKEISLLTVHTADEAIAFLFTE